MIVKVLFALLLCFLAYRAYQYHYCYKEYLRFKKEGVVFNDKNGFSFFRDIQQLVAGCNKSPTDFPFSRLVKEILGVEVLPPVTGLVFLGGVLAVSVNSAEFLEDIYIN